MGRWMCSAAIGCLLAGCQFGTTDGVGADGGLAQGDGAASTGAASGAAVTGIPTGAGDGGDSGVGVSSSGATDAPSTGPGEDDGAEQGTTAASMDASGAQDGSSSTTERVAESSSSDGAGVDDPYEDCAGLGTACHDKSGICYDALGIAVCVPYCPEDTCPAPLSGTSVPLCADVLNFGVPVCGLPCETSPQCPMGMECSLIVGFGFNRCVWP